MASVSTPVSSKKRSARRCLFGRSDPVATNKWIAEKLDQIKAESEARWGFNFAMDTPVAGTSSYEFTAIVDSSVPEFYRTKVIASTNNSPNQENRNPDSSDESDTSMDITTSPIEPARPSCATPKKRQQKVTDYMQIRKKRLQRSPKTADIVLPAGGRSSSRV